MERPICPGVLSNVFDAGSSAYVVQCDVEWVIDVAVSPDWENLGPVLAAVIGLWCVAWLIRMARIAFQDTAV